MSSATTTRTTFSDEQLAELLALIKDSDSVELKLTVPEPHQRSTLAALGADALNAQIRQVFFFDTPELALNAAGVVVRARRIQGKGDDSVVKLRPVVPSELPDSLRRAAGFRVEVDALPGGFVCSGTLKGGAMANFRPLQWPVQHFRTATNAPRENHLARAIPHLVPRVPPGNALSRGSASLHRRLVAEAWFYPDGSRVLELSTRCATGEAFQVATETRSFLAGHGVDLSGEQETKTNKALAYFAQGMVEEER